MSMKKIAFVTLFPDWIRSSLSHSIMARAEVSGAVEFSVVNPRNFCYDQHRKVDDIPYGGHPGMLLKAEPVALAIESLLSQQSSVSSRQSADEERGTSANQTLSQTGESVRDACPAEGPVSFSELGEPVGVEGNSRQSAVGSQQSTEEENRVQDSKESPTKQGASLDSEFKVSSSPPPPAPTSPKEEGKKSEFAPPGSLFHAELGQPDGLELRSSNLLLSSKTAIVITEPSGTKFEQPQAQELTSYDQVIFVCGHYEGIDHRVEETFATHVFSIGDYVLTNGELPAMVMADAVVRLLPGVLGNQSSLEEESFQNNLLGAPNYTRPEVWRGKPIPDVLKSGNHAMIDKWRLQQAKERTKVRRPDLLEE